MIGSFWIWLPGLLITVFSAVLLSRRLFHCFQLESYQFHGYRKTVIRLYKRTVLPYLLAGAVCFAAGMLVYCLVLKKGETVTFGQALLQTLAVCIPALVVTVIVRMADRRRTEKKKYVITARVKRLYAVHVIVLLLLGTSVWFAAGLPFGAFGIWIALLPLLCALSGLIALPVEKLIFSLYFNDARKKLLENKRLIRIGITGSYGKTSTKFVMATILSQKYNVLYTPSSFNTPMGITRIVRERLTPSHQVFIGEMGARHVGEIRQLAKLVQPAIGILTSVGPQHLDTFKTFDRIRKTKYELIEALPDDGYAVFSDDGATVTELYDKTKHVQSVLVGGPSSPVRAENVCVDGSGSSFTLHIDGMGEIDCRTEMLGEHNIRNIVVSAAVAHHLGLSAEQIRRGIASLKPVEHRLQLLRSAGGINVIDDAFNTNPRSSAEALKVLKMFSGRRVLVTPGMVELGKDEERYNREFGGNICGAADLVFLVGKNHTRPILEGMLENGFNKENVYCVSSLDEAIKMMNPMLKPGDTVMYENDLPDNYSEN